MSPAVILATKATRLRRERVDGVLITDDDLAGRTVTGWWYVERLRRDGQNWPSSN